MWPRSGLSAKQLQPTCCYAEAFFAAACKRSIVARSGRKSSSERPSGAPETTQDGGHGDLAESSNPNQIREYEAMPGRIYDVRFSPDGSRFVAARAVSTSGQRSDPLLRDGQRQDVPGNSTCCHRRTPRRLYVRSRMFAGWRDRGPGRRRRIDQAGRCGEGHDSQNVHAGRYCSVEQRKRFRNGMPPTNCRVVKESNHALRQVAGSVPTQASSISARLSIPPSVSIAATEPITRSFSPRPSCRAGPTLMPRGWFIGRSKGPPRRAALPGIRRWDAGA